MSYGLNLLFAFISALTGVVKEEGIGGGTVPNAGSMRTRGHASKT